MHEGLAIGYFGTRLFEAVIITVGVLSLLSILTLRQQVAAGADGQSLVPVAAGFGAVRNWAMAIGGNMAAFNALMLGTALYRARLVPRAIPALGLVGAPILIAFVIGMILGVTQPGTPFHAVAVMPFFIWELALGLWLTFKGFNENSPIGLAERARRLQAETAVRRGPPSGPRQVRHDQAAGPSQGRAAGQGPLLRSSWAIHRAIVRTSGGRFGLRRAPQAPARAVLPGVEGSAPFC